MQITMFTADCTGQAANCSYPNRRVVTTPEEMQEAVRFDHVCAEYKGNYRSIGNFARSDVVVMDIDNDHTEEPAEWITPEKLETKCLHFGRIITVILGRTRRAAPLTAPQRGMHSIPSLGC